MATISDVYRITSRASLAGLRTATKAVRAHGTSIAGMARKAATAAAKTIRAAFSIKTLGRAASIAKRGIATLTRGLSILLTSGLFLVIGALRILPALFGGIKTAMEGAGDAATGTASDLEDVAGAADSAASGIKDTANVIEDATQQVEGIFGAFGAVGAGFIQQQGKIFEQAEKTSEGAVLAAEAATEAMEDYQDAAGGATGATSRFGKAASRIGAMWTWAKNTILQAIGKAITPALEKLAELMESPEFQAFVMLLAEDLADAAISLANWFINDVIPAIMEFMQAVNDAGGPVEFIKKKFLELRITALKALAIILHTVLTWSKKIRKFFRDAVDGAIELLRLLGLTIVVTLLKASESSKNIIESLKLFLISKLNDAVVAAQMILAILALKALEASNKIRAFFKRAFDSLKSIARTAKNAVLAVLRSLASAGAGVFVGMVEAIKGSINSIIGAIEGAINAAIRVINPFLALYNAVADATGGRKLDPMSSVTLPRLARGALVSSPIAAIVGDVPGPEPEVIAPLSDLTNMIRDAFGLQAGQTPVGATGGGTTIIEQIQIVVNADPGGASPAQAGSQVATSFIETMRRRGIQLSTG